MNHYNRHSRESGNPYKEVLMMDPRLRGGDEVVPARILICVLACLISLAGSAFAYDDIHFLPSWQLDDVKSPSAVSMTADRVYVIDQDAQVLALYDAQGKFLKSIGRRGSDAGEFSAPRGLCADAEGRVYVADAGNHRIQEFNENGKFLFSFGSKGSDPGRLHSPAGVAVGKDGRVYVADTGNGRIEVFSRDGIFLFGFGGDGKKDVQIKNPVRVAVDPSDFVYVLDGGDRILKFDPQGHPVKTIHVTGRDFAVDSYGYLYVLDSRINKVRELSPDGDLQGSFGGKGEATGQFKDPSGMAIAPDGMIALVDRSLRRLSRVSLGSKLKTEPLPLNPAAKLLLSGPTHQWPLRVSAMAASDDMLYVYLSDGREFAAVDNDGKIKARFGGRKSSSNAGSKESDGIAVGQAQGIFAADTAGDRMLHFDLKGNSSGVFAQSTGLFASKKKEGRVRSPRGVALNDKNVVYVANLGARRVDAFSPDGAFLFSIGPTVGSVELREPMGVAWDAAGFLYILDHGLKKVIKCEPSGGFVTAWGDQNGPERMTEPAAIAAESGYVFVLDRTAKRVQVYSRDGAWVTDFFSGGEDEKSFKDPNALAIRGSELFVSDAGKGRVAAFHLHPVLAPPVAVSTSAVEGIVSLRWQASPDAWASRYQVQRSSSAAGPFDRAGATDSPEFQDKSVSPYMTYYYRVATEAKTGDVGPASKVETVYVPGAFNRAPVEISTITIGDIFSANYKFYEKNPVGGLTVSNNMNVPFYNIKISFRLKDFMDFGTETVLPRLDAGQKMDIPLKAVLNNRILGVTEDTPIQAEFKLTYFENGKEQNVSRALPLRVFSRNAITWDRPERIATFITLNDTPVKDFERQVMVRAGVGPSGVATLNRALKTAILLWDAVGAFGMTYEPSPNNSFETISQDPNFPVDYTQFPRETFKHKSGQCDDLATLFASLLEAAAVKTALLDYPGHIAIMFDTGASDPELAGLAASRMIFYNDTYWIPFEPTVVGASFADSHRKAIAAYQEMKRKGKASIIDPRTAWPTFSPATMPPTDWSPEAPKVQEVSKRSDSDLAQYVKDRFSFLRELYRDALAEDGKDTEAIVGLGILEMDAGNMDKAAEQFNRALTINPNDAAAMNNLGSVSFLAGQYGPARTWFIKAAEKDSSDPGIWLNLAKASAKLKESAKVKQYGNKAIALDANLEPAVQALLR